jgi:hypothetical protein
MLKQEDQKFEASLIYIVRPCLRKKKKKDSKAPKTYDGEKTASSRNVAGKTGYLHAEN